jgi:adenylate cyclase
MGVQQEPGSGGGLDARQIAELVERTERHLLGGPRRYTRLQVAEQVGVDPEQTRLLWRSLGFAGVGDDEVVFTDADVAALRQVAALREAGVIDRDSQVAMSRVLGQTFSRLAASQGQLLVDRLAADPEAFGSEDAVLAAITQLTPLMQRLQDYVWRRQLAAYFARVGMRASTEAGPALVPMAVGFADMAGFTSLTRRSTGAELARVLDRFESLTTEVVGAHHGRIVKTIGDEVLFVADTPADAALLGLELLDRAATTTGLPRLRIGLAAGAVVTRLGDVFGSTVNIASRLTSLGRPGWILVDRVMAEEIGGDDRFALRPRRPEAVRGFGHLHQWRLGRPGPMPERSEPGSGPHRRRGHTRRGR